MSRRNRARSWVGALLLLGLYGALLLVSWRRWGDPLGDFGHDLYVAWRISEGEVLTRDLAHFNGPFSPYFNGVVLRLFGPHVLSLCLVNAALVLAAGVLLHGLLRRISDRLAATLGTAAFLGMFAFAHLLPAGDFNFVTPYAHEATHGLLFSLLTLWLLLRAGERQSPFLALVAGIALGIVVLTKAEIALAAVAAVAVLAASSSGTDATRRARRACWLAFLAGFAAIIIISFVFLAALATPTLALSGMLGSWRHVGRPGLLSLPNFASAMGLVGGGTALAAAGVWIVTWAVVLVPLLAAALRPPRKPAVRRAVVLACAAYPLALVAVGLTSVPWLGIFRPLPLALAVLLLWQLRSRAHGPAGPATAPLALAFAVFGLVLLVRMAAHTTVCHYGFVLALPGTLVLFAALVSWLPDALTAAGNHGTAFRAGAVTLVAAVIAVHVGISVRMFRSKTWPLGTGTDAILTGDKGPVLAATLAHVERLVPPGGDFLALPGGALLNVMAHRPSPTPFVSFFPPEFAIFGEESILAALRRRPPRLVVLFTRSTLEYGFPRLGVGYGERVMAWLAPRYAPVAVIGGDPRAEGRFGALLLMPIEVARR